MKLKLHTVQQVVVIVSALSAVLDMAVAVFNRNPWWMCLVIGVCAFLITYGISKFFFRQYVVFRIKPLYQLLLSKDIATSRLSKALRNKVDDDVVDDIQDNLDHLISFSSSEIERLRGKDDERTEFLAGVFHEIRTPIFNIEGFAQTLIDGGLEDGEVNRKYLANIVKSAQRLTALVEDIDKLSRYETGGAVMYKDYFDIVDAVKEAVDMTTMRANTKNIKLHVDKSTFPHRKPIMVYADRLRISQLLEELLRNAIFFGHDGGNITVSFVDMFDKVLVAVEDDGIGIPGKDLPYLFDQFYRVDKSRSREHGGNGVGLTGAKRIIDLHEENMTVRSEVGVGSTFSFTLTKKGPENAGPDGGKG